MSTRTPIISIIGRPNVGKSTLFNKISASNKAIVEDMPGVTRDKNFIYVDRFQFPFMLVDTGGFDLNLKGDEINDKVIEQTKDAITSSDAIIVLFDAQSGLLPADRQVFNLVQKIECPVFYVANKCDGKEQVALTFDFYSLGIEKIIDVSALNGRGINTMINDLLEDLPNYESLKKSHLDKLRQLKEKKERQEKELEEAEKIFQQEQEEISLELEDSHIVFTNEFTADSDHSFAPVLSLSGLDEKERKKQKTEYLNKYCHRENVKTEYYSLSPDELKTFKKALEKYEVKVTKSPLPEKIKIAIVGRPNVGKSTLLNRLLGETRAVVSNIAGTTRDALDAEITRSGQQYTIVDTAGVRKNAKVKESVEYYSNLRTMRAIGECDVALVLIDAIRGLEDQDLKIIGMAHEQGKGVIIAVNKWDSISKDNFSINKYKKNILEKAKFTPYVKIIFISALNGQRCNSVFEIAKEIAQNRLKRINTSGLNYIISKALSKRPLSYYKSRKLKIYYATQAEVNPPRFILYANYPEGIHFSYSRYIKNCIRDEVDFSGTDIKVAYKKR